MHIAFFCRWGWVSFRAMSNCLYYGDNLDVLRLHIKDETVDLVYLDPPFKSNQDYNVLFAEKDGSAASAQIRAFEDTRSTLTLANTRSFTVHGDGRIIRQTFPRPT